MSEHDHLPEGITILERKPAGQSVELALELARLGGSVKLVRAAGGEEAVEALSEDGNGNGNGTGDHTPAVSAHG